MEQLTSISTHKTSIVGNKIPLIGIDLTELFFCLSLFAMFVPLKIYPFVYLTSSFVFLIDIYSKQGFNTTGNYLKTPWLVFLGIFTCYASVSFFSTYNGQPYVINNFLKLWVNTIFLGTATYWLSLRDNIRLLKALDITLHLIFLLCFAQLFIYHEAFNFDLIYGSASSGKASTLYNPQLFFWGLDDKNMFGARLALLGFIYVLVPLIRYHKLTIWRIAAVFLLAHLSLSRTPIAALIMGIFLLGWALSTKYVRVGLVLVSAAILPLVAQKFLRIDNITASNDGMGVRITYWKAFFQHFDTISPLGNGFFNGAPFLKQYAAYYHGEPHLHNTFMSCYLELGVIGLLSYGLFFWYFIKFCLKAGQTPLFWCIAFLPLLAIMMILYSGYDNDIVVYLTLIFLLGRTKSIDFKNIKIQF